MASVLALSMNPQVLTRMTSASCEVRHCLVARRQQDVDHHVQIDLILRAAKGNTRNFHSDYTLFLS